VYPVNRKLAGEDSLFIHIKKEERNFLFTRAPLVKAKIYNHFSVRETLEGDIYLEPDSSLETTGQIDFAYLPPHRELKGICAKTLYKFLLGEKMDKNREKWLVMLQHAVQYELVILEDFFKDLSPDEIDEALKLLKDKEKYYLVITNDFYMVKDLADKKNVCYLKSDATAEVVKKWMGEEDG
jgi:hypothetical protein